MTLIDDGYLPEPPPQPRRRAGCSVFCWLVLVVLLASIAPAPSEAQNHAASLAGSGLRGAPESVSRPVESNPADRGSAVTLAGAPTPSSEVGTVLIGGWATWYDTPGFTAAAGPVLRDVLGDWRGRYVTVEAGDRSVVVQLTDWCACGERDGIPTLLDLSRSAFAALADPSLGVVRVSIEIDGSPRPDEADDRMRQEDGGPAATVPPTDVGP